jgi:hypothetical protein
VELAADVAVLHVPFRLVKRGGRKEMQLPDGASQPRRAGNTVVKALARNVRYIKGLLAKQMRDMCFMPELRFRFDEQFDEAARIDRLLHDPRVKRDTAKSAGEEE